jgi:hypothetical protein
VYLFAAILHQPSAVVETKLSNFPVKIQPRYANRHGLVTPMSGISVWMMYWWKLKRSQNRSRAPEKGSNPFLSDQKKGAS